MVIMELICGILLTLFFLKLEFVFRGSAGFGFLRAMGKGVQKFSMESQRDSEFHHHNWLLDPYASDSSNSAASLVKRRSSADQEATEISSHAFNTPVKVEEDATIMDGIPVPRSNKGDGERIMSLPMSSYNSITGSFGGTAKISSTPLLSGGGARGMNLPMPSYESTTRSFGRAARFGSISSPSRGGDKGGGSDTDKYEKQVYRFWQKSCTCRNGNLCQEQFAPEIQEMNPLALGGKRLDIEVWTFRLNGSSSSSHDKDYPTIVPSDAAEYDREFPPFPPPNEADNAPPPNPAVNAPPPNPAINPPPPNPAVNAPPPNPTVNAPPPNPAVNAPPPSPTVSAPPPSPTVSAPPPSPIVNPPPPNPAVNASPSNPTVSAPPPNPTITAPPPNPTVTAPPPNPTVSAPPPNPVVIAPLPNPAVTVPRNNERLNPVDNEIQVPRPRAVQGMNPADVHAYIDRVLYGPSSGKRLPVFKEICPDSDEDE